MRIVSNRYSCKPRQFEQDIDLGGWGCSGQHLAGFLVQVSEPVCDPRHIPKSGRFCQRLKLIPEPLAAQLAVVSRIAANARVRTKRGDGRRMRTLSFASTCVSSAPAA